MRFVFFFNDTATTEIYTLSLHDALPICSRFDLAVGIVERLAEALGELAADGGLSGAHHAHQEKLVLGLHEGIVATHPYRARKQRAGTAGPLPIRSFRSVSAGL